MMSSFNAIVPMACVTAAALAAMAAEAFRARGERMPIGPLGLIGFVGAALSAALLWNRNQASFGLVVADNFGLAMGNLGAYPPLLAAWGPFALFLLIGEAVLIRTEE